MCIEQQVLGMFVRELMSTDVVTVPGTGSLRAAVGELLANEVGSVIVVDGNGNPTGIVTETDILHAAYQSRRSLDEISVSDLSHRPVVSAEPEQTVQSLARQMGEEDVKKVPVMDDLDLVGIVTLTDIVWHLSDIRKEAREIQDAYSEWDPAEE